MDRSVRVPMPFLLDPQKSASAQLARRAERELRAAAQALTAPGGEHAARVRLKRLRALLRLAADALRRRDRRAADAFCAAQLRALGATRDLQSRHDLLGALALRAPPAAQAECRARAEELRERLVAAGDGDARAQVARRLERRAARARKWFTKETSVTRMRLRLRRAERTLRRAARRALREPETGSLHRLRRRVRRVESMQKLLGADARSGFSRSALARLGRRLGDDHDRALLLEALHGDADGGAATPFAAWLAASLAQRRARLLTDLRAICAPRRSAKGATGRPRILG